METLSIYCDIYSEEFGKLKLNTEKLLIESSFVIFERYLF